MFMEPSPLPLQAHLHRRAIPKARRGRCSVLASKISAPWGSGFLLICALMGVALFFHPLHAWLSIVMLLPFVLHLIRNYPGMMQYARRGRLYAPLLIAFLAGAIFCIVSVHKGASGRQVAMKVMNVMSTASLEAVAPLFHMDVDETLQRLKGRHLSVESSTQTIADIAHVNHCLPKDVLMALLVDPKG